MSIFRHRKKPLSQPVPWSITKDCLHLIFECAKSSYPKEFGGFLRADMENKHKIVEIMLLPGTISGDSHAIFHLHMLPVDYTIVGTVHSHPSPVPHPSDADLALFQKYGKVHIIAGYPYDESSWNAFNYKGQEIVISIV
jgi:proteasome lid subunit RPN8/RPN11